ncbi:MAG TPA: tRNA epoxyqueuosine(34) reductase QueG [Eubacteriaceae bacterium]|nr:tRNA epoxyqueuosine(34) reductase QueG [Eubacteriaceae bacterium]
MKEMIREEAYAAGIDLVGFSAAEDRLHWQKIYEKRKEQGYLTGFEPKDSGKILSPKAVFPRAKTVISLGVLYEKSSGERIPSGSGRLSVSSWGQDYHRVLHQKMEVFMQNVKKKTEDFDYKAFVDTGPLLDRVFAYESGIGFFGKNNLIIHPDLGSSLFLGTIVTDRIIDADTPLPDGCGDCTRCLTACPSGALEAPHVFNGGKCIAYLTQKKEHLTRKERRLLGMQIYGCDECQRVCPYNEEPQGQADPAFLKRESLAYPDLKKLVLLTGGEFKKTFRQTAAGWRGKKIFQRNALIAMGNDKSEDHHGFLIRCLRDERDFIRLYALFSLQEYGEKGKKVVEDHLKKEKAAVIADYNQYR